MSKTNTWVIYAISPTLTPAQIVIVISSSNAKDILKKDYARIGFTVEQFDDDLVDPLPDNKDDIQGSFFHIRGTYDSSVTKDAISLTSRKAITDAINAVYPSVAVAFNGVIVYKLS